MDTTLKFLSTLESVHQAADRPETAYLIRTRLKRTLLDCTRMAASSCGLPAPDMLLPWQPPITCAPLLASIAKKCDQIRTESVHLCQPSEALDIRWQESWASLKE